MDPPKRARNQFYRRDVIHEVDESLKSFISSLSVERGIDVQFAAPTREWAARRSAPTVNAFLYDIREDVARRDVAPQAIRNNSGRVIERRPPARRFKLSYLITAWTQRPEDEHRLLSALLSGFLPYDSLPEDHLKGSLVQSTVPVLMTLALPTGPERSLSDIWTALGGEMKPSLDVNIIAPIEPGRAFAVGPPVLEKPTVDLQTLTDSTREQVSSR